MSVFANKLMQRRIAAYARAHSVLKNRSADPTLVLEQFTDANGTSIAAHTVAPTNVPGGGWTRVAGIATIQNNRALVGSGEWIHKACGTADGQVRAIINIDNAGHYALLLLRFLDTSNTWMIGLKNAGAPSFYLQELNAGVATTRASANPTVLANTDYVVVVTLSGQTITATLDGGSEITYASAALNLTEQRFGFRGAGAGSHYGDDFQVTP